MQYFRYFYKRKIKFENHRKKSTEKKEKIIKWTDDYERKLWKEQIVLESNEKKKNNKKSYYFKFITRFIYSSKLNEKWVQCMKYND